MTPESKPNMILWMSFEYRTLVRELQYSWRATLMGEEGEGVGQHERAPCYGACSHSKHQTFLCKMKKMFNLVANSYQGKNH